MRFWFIWPRFPIHKSNPLDHVFELANLFNCPHSKKLSFGIYLPRFSIAQINSISHTLSQRPEFTVGLRKIRPFSKTLFFDLFRHRTPHTISKSHVHPLQHVLPAVTGPNTLGVVSTHSGYSSVASNLHGVLFGTLSSLYFQQNTSPYISHDTDTIMTPNDTGGIEIVPDHSVFCKHWICHTSGPSSRSERLNRRCHFSVRLSWPNLL